MNPVLFIVGAIVGGAVAWGAWSLLPETWRPARWPVAIVMALLVGANIAMYFKLPPTNASVERELLQNPATREMASAWREADPTTFAAFVDGARTAAEDGSLAAMADHAARGINAAIVERLPYLPDADIVALEQNTRATLLAYADLDPNACLAVGRGQIPSFTDQQLKSLPANVRQLGERRMALYASAFRADMQRDIEVITGDELMMELQAAMREVALVVGEDDVQLIAASTIPSEHERRYCEVMAEYENQLSLHPRAGPLYRGLVLMAQN